MSKKIVALASLLVIATMLVAALIAGAMLPADTRLPIHWNAAGVADNHAGKWVALLIPPAVAAGLSAFFYWLPLLEPRSGGLERSQGLVLWSWVALLLMFSVVELACIASGLRWNLDGPRLILCAIGVLLAAIGNQLGKSRSTYLLGIRTPWTLASEEVWIRTHRLGGKLMAGAGLLIILLAFLPLQASARGAAVLALLLVSTFIPVAYSWWRWRREQSGAAHSSK